MNMGFFDLPDDNSKPKTPKGATGCEACGLYRQVRSPKMPATGEGKLGVFALGEAPGETEDALNKQFVGETGQKLHLYFKINGFDLDRDVRKQNAVACRTTNSKGSNRNPTSKEIKFCEPNWRRELNEFQPKFVFLFGAKAVESYFMHRTRPISHNLSIGRFRKLCIPDSQTGTWVVPLYHPSFMVRNPDAEPVFKKDLEWAFQQLSRPSPTFPDYKEKIILLKNKQDVLTVLQKILSDKPPIFFDYETSGLKPYFPGHHIWTFSVSRYDEDGAYSIPFSYPGIWDSQQLEEIRLLWTQILAHSEISKSAQNIQMERPWSKIIMGQEPEGWIWDTMVFAHIMDERPEYTSLDFQTFINFGYEYGEEISPYKEPKNGLHFNSMHECPLDDLLLYNGLDSYFLKEIAKIQWEFAGQSTKEAEYANRAYELFHRGVLAFSDSEETGIPVNVSYYQDAKVNLENRLHFLVRKVNNSPENKIFKSKSGKDLVSIKKEKGEDKVSISTDDLNELLYKQLGLKPSKFTALGNVSVDHSVLEELDIPFAKDIVKLRQLAKLKSTYVEGILDLQVDGRIHPNFNLNLVRTYRSSSSSPNFHNLPRKDKFAMELIRGGIIPSPGNCIIEADYGGHEIRIIACYSKDPVMTKELWEEHDIHGDWSEQLLQTDLKSKKDKRFDTKNAFVFAEIYGSYFKNVWENLYSRGYTDLTMRHVQKVEHDFWKRYKATKKFQEELINSYKENCFVEMFHGFRRRGFLERNMIINTPVQGTAFHLLLWSYIRLNWLSKIEGWISRVIAQIHDSILLDAHPSEISYLVPLIKRVMTQDILPEHPWISVPLVSEVEVTEIDRPWHTKQEYEED